MIDEQHASGTGGGDHFAKPGANDRIWNSLEKHCLRDPQSFAAYYGNDIIALVSEAWLGPAYQMTAQVNRVNPGGAAQSAHRDYHLGFQSAEVIERYPVHVHRLSPVLTLQGAVAHCDMPLESGPTLYLPYSQAYLPGYLATGLPEFKAYFNAHHVQLALREGRCGVLQSGAVPWRRQQPVDRHPPHGQPAAGVVRVWPGDGERRPHADERGALSGARKCWQSGAITDATAATPSPRRAEGYSFPTNLDRDPPIGGLAPETQQALFHRALDAGWTPEAFARRWSEQAQKKLT